MVVFTVVNSNLRHLDLHKFGKWEIEIYLMLSTIIPFLVCVTIGIGIVLRFLGGNRKMAIFVGGCAGLLHFMISIPKSVSIFNGVTIMFLLHVPVAALLGALTYYIISKLPSRRYAGSAVL
jgi:hypothetical protein